MLSKKIIILCGSFMLMIGCLCNSNTIEKAPINSALLNSISTINQSKSPKDLISNNLDHLIIKEIDNQTKSDSTRYLLKMNLQDKYLYTFPIKRSARLNHHIYRLDNAEEVFVGLEGQFNNHFYDSRFNKELGIAKFYFEQTLPDTTLQRFLAICVLDEYQIIEIKQP